MNSLEKYLEIGFQSVFLCILGVLNYELHMPLVISAQMAVNTGIMDTSEACEEFQKAIKCLEECMHHLQYEPTGNFENQLYLGEW